MLLYGGVLFNLLFEASVDDTRQKALRATKARWHRSMRSCLNGMRFTLKNACDHIVAKHGIVT